MVAYSASTLKNIDLAYDRVASMVEQISYSPSGFLQASVDRLCIPYQATLFARYGLHYCSWHSLSSPAFLLPRTASEQGQAIPFNIMLVLLAREAVPEDVFAPINHILDQAISIATTYNLLTAVTPSVSPMQTPQSTSAP